MIPGVKPGALKDAQIDEKAIAHQEAIIRSMTPAERQRPEILNATRKRRIAMGSGTSVEEVNKLLKQFDQIRKFMKQFADSGRGMKHGRGGFGKGKFKIPF
jgi:signal recognition particle subunit SRP54